MNRRGVILAACVAWTALTGAAPVEPWTFDPAASSIEMSVGALGQIRRGRFADWEGRLAFDPARPEHTRAGVTVQQHAKLGVRLLLAIERRRDRVEFHDGVQTQPRHRVTPRVGAVRLAQGGRHRRQVPGDIVDRHWEEEVDGL